MYREQKKENLQLSLVLQLDSSGPKSILALPAVHDTRQRIPSATSHGNRKHKLARKPQPVTCSRAIVSSFSAVSHFNQFCLALGTCYFLSQKKGECGPWHWGLFAYPFPAAALLSEELTLLPHRGSHSCSLLWVTHPSPDLLLM